MIMKWGDCEKGLVRNVEVVMDKTFVFIDEGFLSKLSKFNVTSNGGGLRVDSDENVKIV